MAGTKEGGKKAAKTVKERWGDDFYKRIGSKGGSRVGVKKGFACNREMAHYWGRKGGRISRRGSDVEVARNRLKKEMKRSEETWRWEDEI